MIRTKVKVKIIKKILIMFMAISIISSFISVNKVSAKTNSKIQEISETENVENYSIDVKNEKEVSETIKGLILTINSEGINKNFLSQAINLYLQITPTYTNSDIINIINKNRSEFESNNVKMEKLDSVTTLLKNINTEQLRNVLSKIDIDEISKKVENGESIQSIIKNITENMTTSEKVNFVIDIFFSATGIKNILTILIVLFIYETLLRCVIYKKAKEKAWAAFIPIYRNVVMLKICGMSPWWLLLLLVPVIGWILLFVISVASKFMLAEAFGKGAGFAFGLWILTPIFESILVFSKKTKYIGFEEE